MTVNDLPLINTILNGTAFWLMMFGYVAIRLKRPEIHKRLMLSAVLASACFLVCYLLYHFAGDPKPYEGASPFFYYTVLITHIVLAAAVPFLVGFILIKAFKNELATHRKFARITLPIWAYVSATGVLIYYLVHV